MASLNYSLSRPRSRLLISLCILQFALPAVRAASARAINDGDDFTSLSLEELGAIKVPDVYGASKHTQKVTEAPSAVSIITGDDFKRFGYRTLTDALSGVRGFYTSSDQLYSYIGIRGVNRPGDYGGRTLVTVNGHRMNDPVFDQAFNGHELPLDVDLIERVEVIRGPGSSLYGNNAFFGVINIVTRDGKSMDGFETSGGVARFGTYTGRLSYGKQFNNGLTVTLSASLLESEGRNEIEYPEYAETDGGVVKGMDGEHAYNYFAAFAWHGFRLEGTWGQRHRDVPNAAYGTQFGVAPHEIQDDRAYLELRYSREFFAGWDFSGRVFLDHYQFDATLPYASDATDYPTVFNRDSAKAHYHGGEIQVRKTVFRNHLLTAGAEWRDTTELKQLNYDLEPFSVIGDVSGENRDFAVYLQDEYKIRRDLVLNAGARMDRFSHFGRTVNPRGAVIYSPNPDTAIKALYGQAFRAPNAFESDYTAPGYVANSSLQPETIRSYELVWEQGIGRSVRASSSLFLNRMKDLITQQELLDNDNPEETLLIFQNTDKLETRGAELELEAASSGGWRTRLSYSFVDASDPGTGGQSVNSHKHLAKLGLIAPFYGDKISAGLEVQSASARRTVLGKRVPGYVVANLTIFSRQLVPGLELSASVYNLWDRPYADPVSVDFAPLDTIRRSGRTFRVKLVSRF